MRSLRVVILLAIACCLTTSAIAQTQLVPGLKLIDKSSGKGQKWNASASASSDQGFKFPSATGSVGQVVSISSVTGNEATFDWSTPSSGVTGTSARLTTDAADATAWSTGPQITVASGKQYRVVGEFMIKRGTVANDRDDFQIRIAAPDAGTYVACAIECLDCPAGTTGVPQFVANTNTNTDFTVIDPNGNQGGETFHYRIEGIFKTDGNGGGNVRLTFNKNGGAPTTYMLANSYWALIEIE